MLMVMRCALLLIGIAGSALEGASTEEKKKPQEKFHWITPIQNPIPVSSVARSVGGALWYESGAGAPVPKSFAAVYTYAWQAPQDVPFPYDYLNNSQVAIRFIEHLPHHLAKALFESDEKLDLVCVTNEVVKKVNEEWRPHVHLFPYRVTQAIVAIRYAGKYLLARLHQSDDSEGIFPYIEKETTAFAEWIPGDVFALFPDEPGVAHIRLPA